MQEHTLQKKLVWLFPSQSLWPSLLKQEKGWLSCGRRSTRLASKWGHKRFSDNWTKKAKEQGYAARSVFKLEELDKRFLLLKNVQRVIDFGCAHGSWSRYVMKKQPKVN